MGLGCSKKARSAPAVTPEPPKDANLNSSNRDDPATSASQPAAPPLQPDSQPQPKSQGHDKPGACVAAGNLPSAPDLPASGSKGSEPDPASSKGALKTSEPDALAAPQAQDSTSNASRSPDTVPTMEPNATVAGNPAESPPAPAATAATGSQPTPQEPAAATPLEIAPEIEPDIVPIAPPASAPATPTTIAAQALPPPTQHVDAVVGPIDAAPSTDANIVDRSPELVAAVENEAWEDVVALLKDPSITLQVNSTTSDFGYSLLRAAAEEGQQEVCELLVARNCDVNIRDSNGMTPLMGCVTGGDFPAIVELLLKAGAETGAVTDDGFTALMWATRLDRVASVALLREAGAEGATSAFT